MREAHVRTQVAATVRVEEAELDIEFRPSAETRARIDDLERVAKVERLLKALQDEIEDRPCMRCVQCQNVQTRT